MFAVEGADKNFSEKRDISEKDGGCSDLFTPWTLSFGLSGLWVFLDFKERIGLRLVHTFN